MNTRRDGIIAGEGHETSGNPVKINLIIVGTDPVAVEKRAKHLLSFLGTY